MKKFLSYNPKLKILARNLRNNSTLSEIILWNKIKRKQIQGYDFHRQKPIDNYIVDFFCQDLMLVIEIDGNSHNDNLVKDDKRQEKLESFGIKFLRFSDSQIKKDIDSVIFVIDSWVSEHKEL